MVLRLGRFFSTLLLAGLVVSSQADLKPDAIDAEARPVPPGYMRAEVIVTDAQGRRLQQTRQCGEVPEHATLSLVCPNGGLMTQIEFASYGMPNGGCGSYSQGWCHATSTLGIFNSNCQNRNSCSLAASNGVFGDPCVGTFKRMYASALCGVPCNPPAAANSYFQNIATSTWRWYCNAGYFAAPNTYVDRNCIPDGTWSGSPIQCQLCPVGKYCPGGNSGPIDCAAGYYGNTQGQSTSTCNGCCSAGYRCNAGSTSPTQNRCGGQGELWCGSCSSSTKGLTASNYRTTPITAAIDLRTGEEPCPTGYSCLNGLTEPGIRLVAFSACASGTCSGTVAESAAGGSGFGPFVNVETPGSSGAISWSIVAFDSPTTSCNPAGAGVTISVDSTQRAAQLKLGSAPLTFGTCFSGFRATVRACRSGTSECTSAILSITVTQTLLAPSITDCGARSVSERQPAGTSVGTRLGATNPNTGTSLRWSMPTNSFFTIDSCTGQISTKSLFYTSSFTPAATYSTTITVTNDGSALSLGSVSSTCSLTITIIPVNDPPTITTTSATVQELLPANTVVFRMAGTDPNGDTLSAWTFTVRDSQDPNAFNINPTTGDVTVTKVLDTTVAPYKTLYTYTVSVSDGKVAVTGILAIGIQVVPRPPVTFAQTRSISEANSNAASNVNILPALSASHPQNLALTWTVADPSDTFGISATGVLFLKASRVLDYLARTSYSVVARVSDTAGGSATANVVISVVEINKCPLFAQVATTTPANVFLSAVQPGMADGTLLSANTVAQDPNLPRDKLTYAIVSSKPALAWFDLDPSGGRFSYSTGQLSKPAFEFPWQVDFGTANWIEPATFYIDFKVTDAANPSCSASSQIRIVANLVPPRVLPQTLKASGTNANAVVGKVEAWSAYTGSNKVAGQGANLQFSIISQDKTPLGDTPFTIGFSTGIISVASTGPRFNFNVQPVLKVQIMVLDGHHTKPADSPSNTTITIELAHLNRPPTWLSVPIMFTPSLTAGDIALPLSKYVSDPDTQLAPNSEALTFAIVSGNTDSALDIVASTGQLFVANPGVNAMQYNNGLNIFTLVINVTDAGWDGPRYWATTTVTVKIAYENHRPTAVGPFVFFVDEHTPVGTVVGTFTAADADLGDTLTYSISPAGANLNRPFALSIVTVPGSGGPDKGSGVIKVINDGNYWPEAPVLTEWKKQTTTPVTYYQPIDWNLKFQRYEATVTITDVTIEPLSTTASIVVYVRRNTTAPPYFNAVTRIPGSAVFNISMDEHAPPLTVVEDTGFLQARHKDGFPLTYSLHNPTSLISSLFQINQTTAVLSLKSNAPDLAFNDFPRLSFYIKVTDNASRTDIALVNLEVKDINEAAKWQGVSYTPTGPIASPNNQLLLNEKAAVGSVVGFLRATDADRDKNPSYRNYTLLPSADAEYFNVDRDSGEITLVKALDWWDQSSFVLNVQVADTTASPIVVPFTFTVTLQQENRVIVDAIYVSGDTVSARGINGTVDDPTGTAGRTVTLSTDGSVEVLLVGSGFGPTARRLTLDSKPLSSTTVTATFGTTAKEFTATSCRVVLANTMIACTSAAGFGTALAWNLTINGRFSVISPYVRSSFFAPTITAVTKSATSPSIASLGATDLATAGADMVDVVALNSGPNIPSNLITIDLGRVLGEYSSDGNCVFVSASGTVSPISNTWRCKIKPGIGGPTLNWRINVGGQNSVAFSASAVKFSPPAITNVSAPILNTAGGEDIVVTGSNFGPLNTKDVAVSFSADWSDSAYTVFSATNCIVIEADKRIKCLSPPGVGKTMRVKATVGGQDSALSATTLTISYRVPIIFGLSGPGSAKADTMGAQQVVISGAQFGPVTPLNSFGKPNIAAVIAPMGKYGPNGTLVYTAADCFVSVAHVQMICLTVPGVGKDLLWQVIIGSQPSAIFTGSSTSYAPPVVASYSSPSDNVDVLRLQTSGLENVTLFGSQFGPLMTPVELATYSSGETGAPVFKASNCFVSTAHTAIQCTTMVGAGASHQWKVTIGSQMSTSPVTSYGRPVITSVAVGSASADINMLLTDGGEEIVITGLFFSTNEFLQRVTYGAQGSEYTAEKCRVSANHTEIRCMTVPGTGRRLVFLVTVGGQTSALSSAIAAYAYPAITSLVPATGVTAGGYKAVISGTNFALNYRSAKVRVRFNALGLPMPDSWPQHLQSVYAGGAGDAMSLKWLNELPELQPTVMNGTLQIVIPEGFGVARQLVVLVDGVPSGAAIFDFVAPFISGVSPDRQNVTAGMLRLVIDGRSFCSGKDGCGMLTVNGKAPVQIRRWGHSSIEAVIEDIRGVQAGAKVPAIVTVDGVASNPFMFLKPVPNINKLVAQDVFASVPTTGGTLLKVRGVCDIVGEQSTVTLSVISFRGENIPCPNTTAFVDNGKADNDPAACFTLQCMAPAGLGKDRPIIVTSLGGSSSVAEAVKMSYAPPTLSDAVIARPFASAQDRAKALAMNSSQIDALMQARTAPGMGARALQQTQPPTPSSLLALGVPTLGSQLFFSGSNLGLPSMDPLPVLDIVNGLPLTLQGQAHQGLIAVIPAGDGANKQLRYAAGAQDSNYLAFRYASPTVTGISPSVGPTTGGQVLTLTGMNFGVTAPTIKIGDIVCPLHPANIPFSPSPNHDTLTCMLPPGQGKNLRVSVMVSGQSDIDPGITFSYVAPNVDLALPDHGPTSGRTLGPFKDERQVFRLPGSRIVMLAMGSNFGKTGVVSFERANPLEDARSDPLFLNPVPVPAGDILPLSLFNYLLGTANGDLSRVPGMTVSDDLAAQFGASAVNSSSAVPSVPRMWNDTLIAFFMPAGFGYGLRINVTASQTGTSMAFFEYDAPKITKVINAQFESKDNNCVPQWKAVTLGFKARERNATARFKTHFPDCYPTDGGFPLLITGEGFGPQSQLGVATLVNVAGKVCQPITGAALVVLGFKEKPDHNQLYCLAPSGYGVKQPVQIRVGNRVSALTNETVLNFDPPLLTGFDPNTINAFGGGKVGAAGRNFGDVPTNTILKINDKPCKELEHKAGDYLTCFPEPDVVGAKNVSLLIANQTEPAEFYDVEEKLIFECRFGYYGLEGESCVACPVGGKCPGSERFQDFVNSTSGFWRINATLGSEQAVFCDAERIAAPVALRENTCPVLLSCEPIEACAGNNTCSYGYVGERCQSCLPGKFYRVNGACVKCPENLALLYCGLAVLLFMMLGTAYWLNKKAVSLALIAIGVDYFQVVSMFAKARLRWPPILLELFRLLSIFNLNIEIVAPDCINPGLTFHGKWFFIEALPLLILGVFLLIHFAKIGYKVLCTSKRKSQLTAHVPTLVSTSIVIFRLLYLYLTVTSMSVLSCIPAGDKVEYRDRSDPNNPKDPVLYVNGMVDYPCWRGWHLLLFPVGLATMLLYSVALPIAGLWFIRKNKDKVKYDQILRAKGSGHDELTNPYYRFRKMWSKLYVNYRPSKVYWEWIILARKFLIGLCGLLFRQQGSYQLSMCLLVLFVAFVLHTQHLPYLTHSNKNQVIVEHEAKALAGDPLHSRIESDMKAMASKNSRKRTRQALFALSSTYTEARKDPRKNLATLVVLWTFDANTVESILLASAILVNIIGVMLDSARFAGDKFFLNQGEYAGLAIGCVFIIVSTIIYYITCIVLELTVVFCPQRLNGIFNAMKCCCRRVTERLLRSAEAKQTAQGEGRKSVKSARSSLGMVVNQFFLSNGKGGLNADASGVVDSKNVEEMDAPPQGEVWKAVKDSYSRQAAMIQNLQEENKSLKRQIGQGDASPGAAKKGSKTDIAAQAVRTRTLFGPTIASSSAADDTNSPFGSPGGADGGSTTETEVTSNPLRMQSSSGGGHNGFAALASYGSSRAVLGRKIPGSTSNNANGLGIALSALKSAKRKSDLGLFVVGDEVEEEGGAGDKKAEPSY